MWEFNMDRFDESLYYMVIGIYPLTYQGLSLIFFMDIIDGGDRTLERCKATMVNLDM